MRRSPTPMADTRGPTTADMREPTTADMRGPLTKDTHGLTKIMRGLTISDTPRVPTEHAPKQDMNAQRGPRAAVLAVAAIVLFSAAARGDDSSSKKTPPAAAAASVALLPRDAVVPVSVVRQYFADVTKDAGTGPNETSVGKPIASRSVVFTSADGKKKVTLSVDRYASAREAAAAFQTAVQGSKTAPGFKPAAAPALGQEAFAGSSQVGAEMHFGLGARDGRLIMSATHAGEIPVTPDNSNKLIGLGGAALTAAKQVLGRSGSR